MREWTASKLFPRYWRDRRFESVSLQQRVRCEPASLGLARPTSPSHHVTAWAEKVDGAVVAIGATARPLLHAARQSHNDRRRDCPTVGGAGLTATKRVFKVDDVGEAPSATGILPSVMVRMSHDTLDLASMNADILQRMIVERCQFGDRRPHAPLGAHPCPEPDNRGRGLCDRTGRSVLHACRLAGILRLPRGACTQPLRLTPMLKLGWPATLRIQLRFLTVDEVARVDKAWVHGFAVGREGFDEKSRQPGYRRGELVS